MKRDHERRVAMCAPGAAVTVSMRGYVPPVPDRKAPEPPAPVLATEASLLVLRELEEQLMAENKKSLSEIKELLEQLARTLAMPVRPVFGKDGRIIEARRVIPNQGE